MGIIIVSDFRMNLLRVTAFIDIAGLFMLAFARG
jgi:hypothetical protein